MKKLADHGIGSQVLYIPIFLHPYYKKKYNYKVNDFPNAMSYYDKAVSIPIFYDLKKSELKFISDTIKSILRR